MRPPMPPTRSSTQSDFDSWIFIDKFETGGYTKARSPQLKQNNMSSRQVANASADSSSLSVSIISIPMLDDMVDSGLCRDISCAAAAGIHIPPSNVDSCSTETAGTDDTLPAATAATQHTTTTPNPVSLPFRLNNNNNKNNNNSSYYNSSSPTAHWLSVAPCPLLLTHDTLLLHQREINQRHNPSIHGWITGVPVADRLINTSPSPPPSTSMFDGAGTSSVPGGGRSGCSVASTDWLAARRGSTANMSDEEVAAAGAWCEATVQPLLRRFSVVSVEGENMFL
ncbi:hypothetical protein VTI74DRAFT_10647 [Chaetomium olivicolor]